MKKGVRFDKKKNIPTKYLHNLIIFFGFLLIAMILGGILIIYSIKISEKESIKNNPEDILGTGGIFSSDVGIMSFDETLLTSFSLYNNDENVLLTILRPSGSYGSLNKIVIFFDKTTGNCSYNITSQLPLPSNLSLYDINASNTNCGNNFTGVSQIQAFGIKNPSTINLTQINNISSIIMQNYENKLGAIDLDDYFANLSSGDPSLNFFYLGPSGIFLNPASDFINSRKIDINNSIGYQLNAQVNITLNYPSMQSIVSNNFYINVGIGCNDSDFGENYTLKGTANNFTNNGTDSCYNNTAVIEYYCNGSAVSNYLIPCLSNYYCYDGACIRNISSNIAPNFIASNCNLTNRNWYKNENLTLEISNCFSDSNGDMLSYRFAPLDSLYLTITQNASLLNLVPQINWSGNGSFYVYSTDGLNETSGTVYFIIRGSNLTTNITVNQTLPPINNTIYNTTLSIKDPSPSGDSVTDFFGKNQTFFVSNTVYDSIEWYLDGKIVKINSNSCEIKGLAIGNYTVEVKITRGTENASKSWKVIIQGDEKTRKFLFDAGWVIFLVIIIVVGIIVGLVIWLFIVENNKKNKKINLDLEVIGDNKLSANFSKKDDMSRGFNIPK